MKRFLKIVGVVFLLFVLAAGGGIFYITRGLEAGCEVTINDVDLSNLQDGIYHGEHKAGRWTNEVSVTVKDHKITKVEIVDDITLPQAEVSEEMINTVIEKQSPNVDVVSGATVTSKAYLKAIEEALTKQAE